MGLAEIFEKIEAAKKQESVHPAPAPLPEKPKIAEDFSPTGVAVMVRKALHQKFPQAKFRVRTSKYSGGSSIHVDWTDGPAYDDVEKLVKHMHGSDFDGMADMKVYNDSRFGNDFIFCQRRYSDAAYRAAGLEAAKEYGIDVPADIATDKLLSTRCPARQCNISELVNKRLAAKTF